MGVPLMGESAGVVGEEFDIEGGAALVRRGFHYNGAGTRALSASSAVVE
jgi:hypothetical protein